MVALDVRVLRAASVAAILLAAVPDLAKAQEYGGTLVFGNAADPGALDPGFSYANTGFTVFDTIYNGLVEKDKAVEADSPPIVNALAESWEVSEDGLIYTFHLREGVKFHDGTPFNAEAVAFNVRRLIDKDFEYYYDIAAGNAASQMQFVDGFKVVDDNTFQYILKQPFGGFIDGLASHTFFYIVSPDAIKQYGVDGLSKQPAGTGPFKLVEYVRGQSLVLERNEDYWEKRPYLDRLIFRVIPDATARVAALLNGEIDVSLEIPPDSIATLEANPNIEVYLRGKPHNFSLLPNMREKPFSDPRVRQALSLAIDRSAIAEGILMGSAEPATQFYGIGNPGFDPSVSTVQDPYDPEKARSLLAEAGYPDGFTTKMLCVPSGSGVPATDQIMEYIQSNLADVGINVELELMDWNAYLGIFGKGIPQGQNIGAWCMAIGTDTAYILDMYARYIPPIGWATGWYENEKVADLLAQSDRASSFEEYLKMHREAQKMVLAEHGYIAVTHDLGPYGVNKRVKGWSPSRSASQDVSWAWVDD
jgi:peptide/nickel transport system substrate-binding protein